MIKCLAHYMGVPCYIADATTLTQAGYVGDDVECVISGLLREAKWDMQMAQYGIIAIDEIDKIAKRSSNQSITRDVVGEGVQQALLKMVEGDKIGVPPQQGRKHPDQQLIYVDTRNIMFIGMGAFSGIEDIIKGRMNMNKIGYCVEDNADIANNDDFEPFDYMSQEDLRQFGMIPEFIGRFPIVTNVRHLKKEDLVKILTEPKNSIIKQYQNMMLVDGIELTVSDGALSYIAEIALKLEVGARGLKSLVESVMNEFVFEYAGNEEIKELKITKRHVEANINKRFSNYVNYSTLKV